MATELRVCRTSCLTLLCLLVVAGSLPVSPAGAAPPPNDNFADATEITGLPAEATGSTVDATRELDEPPPDGPSVWFKWTAPTAGGITLTAGGCSAPFVDSVPIGDNWAVFLKSPVFGLVGLPNPFHAEVGRTYWIAVSTPPYNPADPDFCVRLLPGPANDEFAAATPLIGFPVSATYDLSRESGVSVGESTIEPGEPDHGGVGPASPPLPGSVWYSWTATADGPVAVRLCSLFGDFPAGAFAVYTGDRVNGLRWLLTRRSKTSCGGVAGARATMNAIAGEVYRIAVTNPNNFQLMIGTQAALAAGRFLYTAFRGQTDNLQLGLTGAESERALLVEADGVSAANSCDSDASSAQLRCPIPRQGLDVDLGDGNDTADIRLPATRGLGPIEVSAGDGDDTLVGRQSGSLLLDGGPGADRIVGGMGPDQVTGGPGADRIDLGAGSDRVSGGDGADQITAVDGATDDIYCGAGRDHVRIDGVDLPRGCEDRRLASPARAVPISAVLSNDVGDGEDHLVLSIACPVDVRRGCATRIVVPVGSHRTITRRVRVRTGRSGSVDMYTFPNGVLRRGVRVTTLTHRRRGGALKFTRSLGVTDARYCGEDGECGPA